MIMCHGDEKGLVVPPGLAPYQVVIIPVMPDKEPKVSETADQLAKDLAAAGIRAHVDHRDQRPGCKFNDGGLKAVPVRVELGPRDLADGKVVVSQRLGLDEKQTVAIEQLVADMTERIPRYHEFLLNRAEQFRDANTAVVDSWERFAEQVQGGWASAFHCGEPECEDNIKAQTVATPRCIPLAAPEETGECVCCGKPSAYGARVVFARAY
jgi:prolyl-tRNA synthetase